jgi:hypothetical protein
MAMDTKKRYLVLGGAILAAATWASAQAGVKSERPYAVDAEGNVYLALKDEDRVVRIGRDGSELTLASSLDSPTAVRLLGDGNLLVSDALGSKRIDVSDNRVSFITKPNAPLRRYIKVLQPTANASVRWWSYVRIEFAHNLPVTKARFDLEVSFDGGESWSSIGSKLQSTRLTWRVPDVSGEVLLRVTGYVQGRPAAREISSFSVLPTSE